MALTILFGILSIIVIPYPPGFIKAKKMRKKIDITSLRVGMHVIDTGLSWFEYPYLYSKAGVIRSEEEILGIINEGYREAFIDPGKSPQFETAPSRSVEEEIHDTITFSSLTDRDIQTKALSIRKEMAEAKRIHSDSLKLVKSMFKDARMGINLDIESSAVLVERVIDSVMRNSYALISLTKLRAFDEYTYNHSINVGVLTVGFARFIGLPRDVILPLGLAGLLHDLGKARIPDAILNKPGKLTDEEFTVIKKHPTKGVRLLRRLKGISEEVLRGVGEHHEKFNGNGYPEGRTADHIGLFASLISLADVYDALTSERVYKKGIQPNKAMGTIFSLRGQDFFPTQVERFVNFLGIYPIGSLVQLSDGMFALVSSPNPGTPLHPNVKVILDKKVRSCVPRDLDLSRESEGGLRITKSHDPKEYHIDPSQFLI